MRCGRGFCAWRIGSSLGTPCGATPRPREAICCGGSRPACACRVRNRWRMAPFCPRSIPPPNTASARRGASRCGWWSINCTAEPLYRLITIILDPQAAPAAELAALYHERWEIEGALDELKTHLRGAQVVLRSKTPALVRQEVWGLLLAHFAVRGLMHEAALHADEDPDRLSFLHAVRVLRRKLPYFAALPPSAAVRSARRGAGRNPRRAGGRQPGPTNPARCQAQDEQLPFAPALATPSHTYRLRSGRPGA